MIVKNLLQNKNFQEFGFQFIVHVLVFLFYAVDRRNPQIEIWQVVFYIHLAIHANVIAYYLIPKFLYSKKYLAFVFAILASLALAMIIEELILEKIYFPDTRGTKFLGVFYTLMSIVPVVSVLVGFKFAWDLIKSQQEIDSLKTLVKESELAFLKSQINPHFLFNTMNNLYAHAIEQSPKTPQIILDLSAVLRYMLYDCKAERVKVRQEVKHLEEFVKISKMQIEDRGSVTFTHDIADEKYQLAPLILIVFIENAFKHSTSSMSDKIDIKIDLKVDPNGLLTFHCLNTFANERTATDGGIGLENVRKRLSLIYANQYQLEVKQDKAPTYEVLLTIDLN